MPVDFVDDVLSGDFDPAHHIGYAEIHLLVYVREMLLGCGCHADRGRHENQGSYYGHYDEHGQKDASGQSAREGFDFGRHCMGVTCWGALMPRGHQGCKILQI
jgi:hypothetical protein